MINWNWELLAEHDSLLEGPVWTGESLIYNECYDNKTYEYNFIDHTIKLFRDNTYEANGMQFDRSGDLWVCEGGNHSIAKINYKTKSRKIIVESYNSKNLNWPNDLAITSDNKIYFSDPNYTQNKKNNQPGENVYLITSNFGGLWNIDPVTFDTKKPNGVLLSLDQKTLFVAESPYDEKYNRELRSYEILSNGLLGKYKILHDFGIGRGIDGMTLTSNNLIVATAGFYSSGPGPLIYIFDTKGRVLETHEVPSDMPTNCTFGGKNLDTLFVTCGTGKLYKVENTALTGHLIYPKKSY